MTNFRLPDDTRLGAVRLRVADLGRSLAFYRDVLGLHLLDQSHGEARLAATGQTQPLMVLVEHPGARPKPPRTTGLFHVAIRLPDRSALARVFNRLIAAEWPLQGAADHAVSEAIYLGDPDYNGLELYCDRPREVWPWHGDQIAMVTEQLDLGDLLAQASPDPWEGIDPHTDIGHVHLTVSDLAQVEAFYSEQLGFAVTQRNFPGALFVAAGGYHHHLGLNTWGAPRSVAPPDAAGLIAFEIVLPDAWTWQTVRARLDPDGASESPDGNSLMRATFADPNEIGVVLVTAG